MWVAVCEEAAVREVPSPERLSRVSHSFNVRLWSSGLHLLLKYMDYAKKLSSALEGLVAQGF